MNQPRWSDVLDSFEDRLDAQVTALDLGVADVVPPFVPPTGLSPLPGDLAERATQLTQRCRAIEQDIARALESAGIALERLTSAPAPAPSAAEPVYFDSRV